MPGIFISYRRKDSAGSTGRLYDRLCLEFGKEDIFIDVENIPVGQNFVDYIQQQVRACSVVLIIIGPQWMTIPDSTGKPRIQNPDDTIHLEIVTALHERKTVIPVLVDQATMPKPGELPPDIAPLAFINASELTPQHWEADVIELIGVLRQLLPHASRPIPQSGTPTGYAATSQPGERKRLGCAKPLAIMAVAGVAVLVLILLLTPDTPPFPTPTASSSTSDTALVDPSAAPDAAGIASSSASDALPTVEDVEQGLQQVNITLSTGTAEDIERVRGYMADPEGAYYLLARTCLEVIADRRLAQTGYLDMIDKWYTIVVGGEEHYLSSDGTLKVEAVKEAVVKAQNEYYGETATSFDEVLAPEP